MFDIDASFPEMINNSVTKIYVVELCVINPLLWFIMKKLRISQTITKRDSDSVERYLNDITKIELLSLEEEVFLNNKICLGDQAALNKLIGSNLRFVVSVAKKYQDNGMVLSDLISEGNLGLIKAAERFDHTKGFKFISYAVWWIRQMITLAIAEQKRTVRLPGNQISGILKINKAILSLEQELEREPTCLEIAEFVSLPEEKVREYMMSNQYSYSLDMVKNHDSGLSLLEIVRDNEIPASDANLLYDSLLLDLRKALHVLPFREQEIIMLFYGLYGYPQTSLEDMVPVVKLSKERIRQLKDQAHRTLKMAWKGSRLADYFNDLK